MNEVDLSYIVEDLRPLAVPIDSVRLDPHNARTDHAIDETAESLDVYGQRKPIVVNRSEDNKIEAGNGTWKSAQQLGWTHIAAVFVEDDPDTAVGYAIVDNQTGSLSRWDDEVLAKYLQGLPPEIPTGFDDAAVAEVLERIEAEMPAESQDAEPEVSRADELREEWGVELGQMWRLPSRTEGQEHRLICGDCTDEDVVGRLFGDETAVFTHADPPYGMGKEKDGIANDNLYRDKLDAFQMSWWTAQRPYLADNGSAYIWGSAKDLWRLWYVGGMRDSERLTLRNEIVWDKGDAGAGGISHQGADGLRLYPQSTERALFFMLGEQGFNNNADNYWEGWEPIRAQLKADCDKMGWGAADIQRICGVGMYSHWFTESQWAFIPEEHYKKLQAAAREHDAFKREHDELKREHDELKREHDELKREFYATRAYFDNTHDNMTDVWSFPRVQGEDRYGHATPKPVAMVERAVKSSSQKDDIVYAPFAGTWPEVIAAENLSRQCRAVEISPSYVAVALQRYQDAFGITPELIA